MTDRMTTKRNSTTTGGYRFPGKRRMISFLGIVLLLTCLFAGFVQAADEDNELNDNGLFAATDALTGDSDKDQAWDPCGYMNVWCYAKVHENGRTLYKNVGMVQSACWEVNNHMYTECSFHKTWGLDDCKKVFSDLNVVDAKANGVCRK